MEGIKPMSDESTNEAAANEESAETTDASDQGQSQSDSVDEPLGEGGKRALEAERKARREAESAATELRKQLDAAETAQLSDLERAQKAAQESEEKAAKASALVDKLRIVARHGLTEEDVELLPDNLEAAEKAAARMAAGQTDKPKSDPTQGGMGGTGSKSKGDKFADFANTFFTR